MSRWRWVVSMAILRFAAWQTEVSQKVNTWALALAVKVTPRLRMLERMSADIEKREKGGTS